MVLLLGPSTFFSGGRRRSRELRIAVAGDASTGKSTLIAAMASGSYSESVPPLLPPTRLPHNLFNDSVPLILIDTPSSLDKQGTRNEELKQADAVVLTYDCEERATFERLSSYWLPELRRLEVKAPVVVVGCKLDLRDDSRLVSLESFTAQIMQQFKEVVTCIECSAATMYQVPEVFYFAQKSVLHPVDPLFDYERNALTDRCVRALRRIFVICDQDMDGALNDEELNEYQVRCFNAPLQPSEITRVKRLIEQKVPEGVNYTGLTFPGFIYIHNMYLKKGSTETFWTVLRKFGYDNNLKLRDDCLPVPSKKAPDQSVELTSEAIEFLNGTFRLLDTDKDRSLCPAEVDKLFNTAPESGNPATALQVTRRRSTDRKKQTTERNVFQCYVLGSKNAGKSALLNSFLERPFSDSYTPTTVEQYAANVVELIGGTRKTLILCEIPEDGVSKFLSNQNCLAACDVALFVYDSSDEHSWRKSRDLLERVVRKGELTGYRVPCLLIAAKDDLTPHPRALLDSVKVAQQLGIEVPIHVSMKLDDSSYLYQKIVKAAEHPHLNIPESETAKKRKQQQQFFYQSLMFALVGAAVAAFGLSVSRARAIKKSSVT
ncbi:mitochondrial Rho GTPase 2 isoform X2 [Arachis ipaensis]|uniref:mitochondrial Rho GTPase 2 isoform X2 n=1 Tax=Arachis ipaensis TaxID=130454 RepID=UPI000A2B04B9|nr:mitochondrial Rho GTPase 2 isoform X2 [Arachis ipaensis]